MESDLLPSEDESSTASDDSRSHTSLEEVDRLDPNMLLYKVHVTIRWSLFSIHIASVFFLPNNRLISPLQSNGLLIGLSLWCPLSNDFDLVHY